MNVRFTKAAHKNYIYWKTHNTKVLHRIHTLCKDIELKPFEGIGKPEPLKYDLQSYWSRRIDKTNRLVYSITKDEEILILSCRYHSSSHVKYALHHKLKTV